MSSKLVMTQEYVKNLSGGGMQPRYGLEGQASACWNHRLHSDELESIRAAGIIVAVVHGRYDAVHSNYLYPLSVSFVWCIIPG